MTRLAETVDGVIGVDTHRDTLAAEATDRVGGTLAQISAAADWPATRSCSASRRRRSLAGAAGRSRAPAATALG
jgi:hypothetical protein